MKYDQQKFHRRSIRLQGFDYSSAGAYFVTIVAWRREMLFGDVVDGEMKLNQIGEIVSDKWRWLESQYEYVELGAWIVMPNHFPGILVINGRGGLIGAFKTVSTKHINLLRNTEGQVVWQRNYYEHIIRNEREWENIHSYIESNPSMWADDDENPNRIIP